MRSEKDASDRSIIVSTRRDRPTPVHPMTERITPSYERYSRLQSHRYHRRSMHEIAFRMSTELPLAKRESVVTELWLAEVELGEVAGVPGHLALVAHARRRW